MNSVLLGFRFSLLQYIQFWAERILFWRLVKLELQLDVVKEIIYLSVIGIKMVIEIRKFGKDRTKWGGVHCHKFYVSILFCCFIEGSLNV